MKTLDTIRRSVTTLAALALALTVAGCGGAEDSEAFASDAVEEALDDAPDQTAYGFDDIDMDGDSELDADEFHEWTETPVFAFYMQTELVEDPDEPRQTGALDAVVLIDALFGAWDVNDDGALDPAEWEAATRVISGLNDTEATWIEFDVDGNEIIDVDEIHAQLEDDRILAGIDADQDGIVEEQEMNEWFFAIFDNNEDGVISRDEWRLAEIYLDIPVL